MHNKTYTHAQTAEWDGEDVSPTPPNVPPTIRQPQATVALQTPDWDGKVHSVTPQPEDSHKDGVETTDELPNVASNVSRAGAGKPFPGDCWFDAPEVV